MRKKTLCVVALTAFWLFIAACIKWPLILPTVFTLLLAFVASIVVVKLVGVFYE